MLTDVDCVVDELPPVHVMLQEVWVADDDEQGLCPSDGHVEALLVLQVAELVPENENIKLNKGLITML